MDLDLGCVASLLVLLEEKHYGRAADRLHLTASALTKRIQRLERQIGVPLVRRSARGVEATEAGRRFAVRAKPLLASAEAARRAALAESPPSRHRITLGIPAGPHGFLSQIDLAGITRAVRSSYPEMQLQCRLVPFPQLTSCLLDEVVDVLLTVAPVAHVAVVSAALPISVGRVGIVGSRSDLADAASVDVGHFVDLPILYNPDIPDEWMSVFYLGDVRPMREARLVRADAADTVGVLRAAVRGAGAITAPAMFVPLIRGRLHPLELRGAPDIVFYAAHRRAERRGAVQALVAALTSAPSQRLTAASG